MFFNPGEIYHIYNRGNNKKILFHNEESYLLFLNKMKEQIKPISDILAWTLMPNHFHLMLHANEKSIGARFENRGLEIFFFPGLLRFKKWNIM